MSAPLAVQAAVAALSGHVVCLHCGAVTLGWREDRDNPVIEHPYTACEHLTDPESPSAVALAEWVLDELAALVTLAQYGEPLPVHEWAVS
jgi:hypothetical protein